MSLVLLWIALVLQLFLRKCLLLLNFKSSNYEPKIRNINLSAGLICRQSLENSYLTKQHRNAIKKKTRTTVDISYRKMENSHHNDNNSQLSLGIASSLNAGDPKTSVWGANGSATNITKAWAGKEKKQKRASFMMDEDVEMEKLGLCAGPSGEGGMDNGDRVGRKVAFENMGGSGRLVDDRG